MPGFQGRAPEVTGRTIEAMSLGDSPHLQGPMFVKPPAGKGFDAGVYTDGTRLPGPDKLPVQGPVKVSEVVTLARGYRLLVLEGAARAASRCVVFGRLAAVPGRGSERDAVLGFAGDLLDAVADSLPSAVDEANMGWFANSYAADPDLVLSAWAAQHRTQRPQPRR